METLGHNTRQMFDSKAQELDFLRLRVSELENEINAGKKVSKSDKKMAGSKSVPQIVGGNSAISGGTGTRTMRRRRRREYPTLTSEEKNGPMSADERKRSGFLSMQKTRHTRSDQSYARSPTNASFLLGSKSEGNSPAVGSSGPVHSRVVVKDSHNPSAEARFRLQRSKSERKNLGQELGNGDIYGYPCSFGTGIRQGPSGQQSRFNSSVILEESNEHSDSMKRNICQDPFPSGKPTQILTVRKRDGRLAEHKTMQQFGVQPSEIVDKLRADQVISEVEKRIIMALVDSDHVEMLNALFSIEREGTTKKSVEEFRIELSQILAQNVKTVQDQEDRRQHTINKNHPLYRRASMAGRQLRKIAVRLNQLVDSVRPKLLIVGSGAYNPIHKLHLRMFYVARRFLEEKTDAEVVGGVVSPSHPTLVRQKYRTRPREIIPSRHRLAITKIAVGESSWLTVDPWEISRRRIMDYLSVLDHVGKTLERAFPHLTDAHRPIQILYLCKGNSVLKLNPDMMREKGYGCVCVCRPLETERLLQMMGKRFAGVAHVVEDRAILSHQLERTCSHRVRQELIQGNPVEDMTGEGVAKYIKNHQIGDKMAGRAKWTRSDNDFSFHTDEEKPYANSPMRIVRPENEMPLSL